VNRDKLSAILGRPAELAPLGLTLRYPPRALRWEAIKGAFGALLCGAMLFGLEPAALIAWPVGGAAILFVAYAGQQIRRTGLRYHLDADGISRVAGGRSCRVSWTALDRLRLNFYSHRRKSQQGTLSLVLGAGAVRLRLDSGLDHFPTLLLHAAAAARGRALQPDPTTEANLAALGL
jgi:hypothetical protein